MKACALVFLFVFCYAECRKTYVPIDKNANLAFINMEGGGGVRPTPRPAVIIPPAQPNAAPAPTKPANTPPTSPTKPGPPSPVPTPKPAVAPTQAPAPKPVTQPPQVKPKPVNPSPVANPITTPGPSSVKQLVNFYDSQGKASPIRPYSYSQAVKQG